MCVSCGLRLPRNADRGAAGARSLVCHWVLAVRLGARVGRTSTAYCRQRGVSGRETGQVHTPDHPGTASVLTLARSAHRCGAGRTHGLTRSDSRTARSKHKTSRYLHPGDEWHQRSPQPRYTIPLLIVGLCDIDGGVRDRASSRGAVGRCVRPAHDIAHTRDRIRSDTVGRRDFVPACRYSVGTIS